MAWPLLGAILGMGARAGAGAAASAAPAFIPPSVAAPAAATAGRSLLARTALPSAYMAAGGLLSSMLGGSREPTPTPAPAAPAPAPAAAPEVAMRPMTLREQMMRASMPQPTRIPEMDRQLATVGAIMGRSLEQALAATQNLPPAQRAAAQQQALRNYIGDMGTFIGRRSPAEFEQANLLRDAQAARQ